jgi:hypothetical protein
MDSTLHNLLKKKRTESKTKMTNALQNKNIIKGKLSK